MTTENDSALDTAAEEVASNDEAVEIANEETTEQETTEEDNTEDTTGAGDITEDDTVEESEADKALQKERSRVGRRMSALEERMDKFLTQAERLVTPTDEAVTQIDPDSVVTAKEVEEIWARKNREVNKSKIDYDNSYVYAVSKLANEESEDFANKVMDEMDANYNNEYSTNGGRDAEINWLKASVAVHKQGTTKNPLRGKKPKAPLGVGGADTNTTHEWTKPKLDAFATDLLAHSNLTDEEVEKALSSNKIYTSGERNSRNV